MAVAAIGLTPMSPMMSDDGTVEMPDLPRMAKSPAVRRSTPQMPPTVTGEHGGVGGPLAAIAASVSSARTRASSAVIGGSLTTAFCRLTAVCARRRPLIDAPVMKTTSVFTRKMPSTCASAPMATLPAACQKTFFAMTPPARMTRTPAVAKMTPVVFKMKTSVGPPVSVTSVLIFTPVVHEYTPDVSVSPPISPPLNSFFEGSVVLREAASVYANSMSPMAAVIFAGVGAA
mmetsp:Transcript_19199/g.65928  ORF Transcript_19199/g.65928 Transcript_19199/m.65928 type:complete len:231 (+) Transcript_19199:239-931(+)